MAVLVPSTSIKGLDLVDLVVAGHLTVLPEKPSDHRPVNVERCRTADVPEVVEVVFFRHSQLPFPERVEVAQGLVLPLQAADPGHPDLCGNQPVCRVHQVLSRRERAVRDPQGHAVEQASRRWRGGASREFSLCTDPHPLELAIKTTGELGLQLFLQKRSEVLPLAEFPVVTFEVLERAGIEVEEHDVVVVHAIQ